MEQIRTLLKYFEQFQFTDVMAFGQILLVEEQDDFMDYVTLIAEAFAKEPRKKRRQLLKLAKDVAAANKLIRKEEEERGGSKLSKTTSKD